MHKVDIYISFYLMLCFCETTRRKVNAQQRLLSHINYPGKKIIITQTERTSLPQKMPPFIYEKWETKQDKLEANLVLEPSLRAVRQIASGRSFKAAFSLLSLKMLYYYCCYFLLKIGEGGGMWKI